MKEYFIAMALRVLLRLFYIFPIKKGRVVLTAYNGRTFSCSPKYIALALLKKPGFEVVYALGKGATDALPSGIRRVRYKSLRHFYDLMTAQYIVVNCTGLPGLLPYRRGQTLIDTWHGAVALKAIDHSMDWDEYNRKIRDIMGRNTDVFLSSCTRTSEQYSRAMSVPLERFLHIGLPRNDLFFHPDPGIRERVCQTFGIAPEKKIVLYAPTYRDGPTNSMNGYGYERLDVDALLGALSARFGGQFVCLFKAHHEMLPDSIGENCVNASAYSDIQELLYASEVLVTDYSSCMWDHSLLYKPAFLFTPDFDVYGREHRYGLPVEEWPYETANTNAALLELIAAYDEKKARARMDHFFDYMGGRDDGAATERLLKEVIV